MMRPKPFFEDVAPLHQRALERPHARRILDVVRKCALSMRRATVHRVARTIAGAGYDHVVRESAEILIVAGFLTEDDRPIGNHTTVRLTEAGWREVGGKPGWMIIADGSPLKTTESPETAPLAAFVGD